MTYSLYSRLSEDATERGGVMASEKSTRAADRTRVVDIAAQIVDLERSIRVLLILYVLCKNGSIPTYTSSYDSLPQEIMSEISVHFLPVYPLAPPLTGLFSPTLLTHLCRHWRDIAHATPALWRAISLFFTKLFSPDEPYNNLLHLWMSMSRFYPISLSINGEDNYDDPFHCIVTLASHRAQWEYLELSRIAGDLVEFLCDPMPSLHHLDVSFHDDCHRFILGDAPLLRSVKFFDCPEIITLPWRQLTSLVLVSVYPSEATLLVHCEISFCSVEDVQQPDIELPFLHSFVLIEEKEIQPPCLYSLIFPSLRTLQIPHSDLGTDPIRGLTSFISKSGCALRELRITGKRRGNDRERQKLHITMHFRPPCSPRFDLCFLSLIVVSEQEEHSINLFLFHLSFDGGMLRL